MAGFGWDDVNISGTLNLQASSSNRFVLQLCTLTATGVSGSMQNFNPASNYAWTFAVASGGILGFDPNAFTVETGGFLNVFNGSFSVSNVGNTLVLNYLAVPEPGAAWLVLAGLAAFSQRRWRRGRSARYSGAPGT